MISKMYRATFALSLLGVLLSLMSILDLGAHPGTFAWLFLYLPFLWALWVCCAVFIRRQRNLVHLLILWGVIDIAVLLLFLSSSMGFEHWTETHGADVVLFVTSLPVLMPTLLPTALLPDSFQLLLTQSLETLLKLCGNRMGEGFACWLYFSLSAVPQSLFLLGLGQLIMLINRKQKISN